MEIRLTARKSVADIVDLFADCFVGYEPMGAMSAREKKNEWWREKREVHSTEIRRLTSPNGGSGVAGGQDPPAHTDL